MSERAAERGAGPGDEVEEAGAEPAAGTDDAATAIETLRREADENFQKFLRVSAELENLRKRNARELENARKFGSERLALGILPVRDSLEAALDAASSADASALIEGGRAILRLLDQALVDAGVSEIDPQGEPFDPSLHEAMSMLPSAGVEPDTVVQVVQKGYTMHGRLMRPARVVVAQADGGEPQA
jgi:molecular chaperone GrpE